jgi:predicted ATPase
MLIDEQRLRDGEGAGSLPDFSTVPTPPSVEFLAARIEQLPDGQRAILQRASVVGDVFW